MGIDAASNINRLRAGRPAAVEEGMQQVRDWQRHKGPEQESKVQVGMHHLREQARTRFEGRLRPQAA
jgi:hypothetical protein